VIKFLKENKLDEDLFEIIMKKLEEEGLI